MQKPAATYLPDSYRFNWPDDGVQIVIDRIREDRSDGLRGDLIVESSRPPSPGLLLAPTNIGLTQPTWRNTVSKALSDREPSLDWRGALEQVVYLTSQRWRQGEGVVDFRDFIPGERPRWLLRPYIERGNASVLFAMGGTGKSLFAMACAVSVASGHPILGVDPDDSGPVLYLDWESDAETHFRRMMAICRGVGIDDDIPPVHYRRQYASLYESAPDLRRLVAEIGAVLVVVDSFGAARGGEPESADTTIKGFNAARSLGVSTMFIDHVTKAADEPDKPFGSVYTHNLARLSWGMVGADKDDYTSIALINHKSNNGRRGGRYGFNVYLDQDEDEQPWSIRYNPTDVTKIRELAGKVSVKDSAIAVLKDYNRAMSIEDLLEALRVDMGQRAPTNEAALRATLNKYKDVFTQAEIPGTRRMAWALLSRVAG